MRVPPALIALASALLTFGAAMTETFLIDDFSREDVSALGTRWQAFTDRVMGGLSNGRASFETIEGKRCLRLRGEVSLENQGGFIQAALPLAEEDGAFDASGYRGVRLWARGNGTAYYVHLRTDDSRRPWQYYAAAFEAGPDWKAVDLPFAAFTPENLDRALDARRLRRLAVVAAKKAFSADVAVARIEFYR
jgi:hypothetical protein